MIPFRSLARVRPALSSGCYFRQIGRDGAIRELAKSTRETEAQALRFPPGPDDKTQPPSRLNAIGRSGAVELPRILEIRGFSKTWSPMVTSVSSPRRLRSATVCATRQAFRVAFANRQFTIVSQSCETSSTGGETISNS